MRTFHLFREVDDSGISGTGWVAEGVQFENGQCVLKWLAGPKNTHGSVCIYYSVEDLRAIHGHAGHTTVVWDDEFPR